MSVLYYESQYFTTTLSVAGGINDSVTTGIVLQAITGIHDTSKPGIALLSYADPLDTSVAEWVTFTSINSTTKTLVGVTRGAEGFSAKSHGNGVTVAFPHSKSHINGLIELLTGTTTGARINRKVATTTDDATAEINCDNYDDYVLSAIANDTEFTITGTPTEGQTITIYFKDAGVAKDLTFTGITAIGVTLPTTTTAGKWGYVGIKYNSAASAWHALATGTEA